MLIRPARPDDEQAVRAADPAMAPFAFSLDLAPGEPFAAWLSRRADEEAGKVPAGRVPATFRLAEANGTVVGRISVRFELNAWLAQYGGHVGYGVLPPYRGKGLATAMLRSALPLLREHGVEQALVTCEEDNAASARVAEHCAGVLVARVIDEAGRVHRQYHVPTLPRPARR